VAVFYIPTKLGGWSHIFGTAQTHFATISPTTGKPLGTFVPTSKSVGATQFDFAALALGSAIALFLYPHTITGALAAKKRNAVKRNMIYLPMYSVLLALIALFGYMAIADPITAANVKKAGNAQLAVPYLFQHMFPSWFTGIAFAGIIIGALVPAAIMAIAAANLFTRNVFVEFFKQDASPELQTKMSQWVSLLVKVGALLFAIELPHTFSINLQLLGGVWILQLAPMLIGGLFTRWFHRWALLAGWLAGMAYGTVAAYNVKNATTSHWASSSDIVFGHTIYIGLTAVIINLVIAVVLTLVLRAGKVPEGTDETLPHQYTADPEDKPARAPAGVGA
jgi:SSS family solute:Na+ symporter